MKIRAHILVSGRVQGVFFRAEARQRARKHNVAGWIRNLSDGRVEAVFEGEKDDVEKMLEFCKRGPSGARVSHTEVSWEAYAGKFEDFRIDW
ncbi:MAG: acylphosphatase [Candidatus Bathyarchaeia archaeon]